MYNQSYISGHPPGLDWQRVSPPESDPARGLQIHLLISTLQNPCH